MANFQYLYYFSSPVIDIVEIKRLDLYDALLPKIYKWLVILNDSGNVWELDFNSMDKKAEGELRVFAEGSLKFDNKKALLTIFKNQFPLVAMKVEDIPSETTKIVNTHIDKEYRKSDLYCFRDLKPSDLKYFNQWITDKEVIRYSMTKFHRISNADQIMNWYDSTLRDSKTFQLGIVDTKTAQLIGYAGIAAINDIDRNGEFFIFIGNKDYWGKGIASDATKKILEYGFFDLKLHRIFLTASDKNLGAIKAYAKAGFKQEGLMREAFYRNNEFSNKVMMGILRHEFGSVRIFLKPRSRRGLFLPRGSRLLASLKMNLYELIPASRQ